MPKVSVVMSVYKEPTEWLRLSVDSILGQTFTDFEFIIVNDCPDREENVLTLDDYSQRDSRITIITNEVNMGLTKSLNKALAVAQGEYIARMDADDISLPTRFEKQVTYLDSHSNICAVGSWLVDIDENGKKISDVVRYETDYRWIRAQFLQNSQLSHPSAMFRRKVKDYTVRYDESIRYAQDYALWVSMLSYGEIANIPEVLLKYRTSNIQITSSKKAEQQTCAGITQKEAFALFDFPPTESFLKMYFAMTVQHNMDLPANDVKKEFYGFFKKVKMTRNNTLALEIILSSYLSFLQKQSGASKAKFAVNTLKNNSLFMLMLGCKLGIDLYRRKYKRK